MSLPVPLSVLRRTNRGITIHAKRTDDKEEYFFSTDHCQGVKGRSEVPIPEGFVPTTFYLPMSVVPRPCLPSGRVETLKDLLLIFFQGAKEIPNPDPKYQP